MTFPLNSYHLPVALQPLVELWEVPPSKLLTGLVFTGLVQVITDAVTSCTWKSCLVPRTGYHSVLPIPSPSSYILSTPTFTPELMSYFNHIWFCSLGIYLEVPTIFSFLYHSKYIFLFSFEFFVWYSIQFTLTCGHYCGINNFFWGIMMPCTILFMFCVITCTCRSWFLVGLTLSPYYFYGSVWNVPEGPSCNSVEMSYFSAILVLGPSP